MVRMVLDEHFSAIRVLFDCSTSRHVSSGMVFLVIESAASHLSQLRSDVSHRQRLAVADNQRVLHVLLRRGLIAKSVHLVLRTLGRTLGRIVMVMRLVTSLHSLHFRVHISSWGLLLVHDVRGHRTVA